MRSLEGALDRSLTVLFSPLALVGIKKCSRCTVRTRLAQAGMLATWPLAWLPPVRGVRVRWDMAAHPAKRKLHKVWDLDDPELGFPTTP